MFGLQNKKFELNSSDTNHSETHKKSDASHETWSIYRRKKTALKETVEPFNEYYDPNILTPNKRQVSNELPSFEEFLLNELKENYNCSPERYQVRWANPAFQYSNHVGLVGGGWIGHELNVDCFSKQRISIPLLI